MYSTTKNDKIVIGMSWDQGHDEPFGYQKLNISYLLYDISVRTVMAQKKLLLFIIS